MSELTEEKQKITFKDLNISDRKIENLKELKIETPTNVQKTVIPEIMVGNSVFFQSETGTGKTFAYLLPFLQKINPEEKNPQIIIVAPTHELCSQIKGEIGKLTEDENIKSVLCFGGSPLKRQIESLKEKPQIIIGSSTRIKELILLKKLKTNAVISIVYDEIDRLLSPELRDDSVELLKFLDDNVQIIGNSATVTSNACKIFEAAVKNRHRENKEIKLIKLPMEDILKKRITHWAIFSESREKIDTLRSFIAAVKPEKALIFTSKLDQVENIAQKLQYKKVQCEALHAKFDRQERKAAIDRFRSGKVKYLVTSDLTSRGMDFIGITHVIQMDLPSNEDFFIHRSGRTGRASLQGINVVIGDEYEMKKYSALEKKLGLTVYPKILKGGKLFSPEELEF